MGILYCSIITYAIICNIPFIRSLEFIIYPSQVVTYEKKLFIMTVSISYDVKLINCDGNGLH